LQLGCFGHTEENSIGYTAKKDGGAFHTCDYGGGVIGVCKKAGAIPDGYVIVGDGYCDKCPKDSVFDTHNAWRCQVPDPTGTTICKSSPIPQGYIIISEVTSLCPRAFLSTGKNGWVIKKATDDLEIACLCTPGLPPPGYKKGKPTTLPSCPIPSPGQPNAVELNRIKP
jgi:hypothetical protein